MHLIVKKTRWTEQAVRSLYEEYMALPEGDRAYLDLARKHGIPTNYMYLLFAQYGLPTRTQLRNMSHRHWTKEDVRAVAQEIVQFGITVEQYAREHKMDKVTLYHLLTWAGCRRKAEAHHSSNGICPEKIGDDWETHLFCAWCPLAHKLPCAEWDCKRCKSQECCPCYHAELRTEEWQQAYKAWQEMRRRNERSHEIAYGNYLAVTELRNVIFEEE